MMLLLFPHREFRNFFSQPANMVRITNRLVLKGCRVTEQRDLGCCVTENDVLQAREELLKEGGRI